MNVRIFFYLVVTMLCLSGCNESPEDRQKEANQYYKSADQLMKQGQLRAALVQAKNVIQLIPDSAQGYLQVTRIYNRIGYYSEVEKLIGSKINTMPELAYPLAYSYYQRKKYRSVLDTLNLTAAPEDPAVNLLRALCHLHLGEDILFEKDLKSLEQEKDNPYLLYARAKSAEARGDLLKAESFLKQILSTAPIYIDAITDLAEIYFKQSRFDAAEQRLTQALAAITNADTLTVEKARVLTMMVEMLVQQGRSSEAYTYQKILATANPELDFMRGRFDEALEFYAEGNIERARSVLIDLHQSFPNNSNVTTLLGVIAFQLGQDEEAETYLSQVIDPETATSSLIYASSLLKTRNNKIDDAITLLKSAVEAQPRNAQLLSTYGLALLQKDPLDKEAVLALEKSIVMDPKQQRLRLALADRHYRLGEVEQGFAQLESAYRQTPLDILIAQNYFRQLKNVSGEKLVLTEIAALKEKFPTEAQARLIEAWWMLESKRYAEVEKLLVKQMDSFAQAEKMSAYLLLADNYTQQNKPEAARKVLEEYLRESPQSLQIYNQWLGLINPDQLPAAFAFLQELQTADETRVY
jgi:predicted Zn-dependent protease